MRCVPFVKPCCEPWRVLQAQRLFRDRLVDDEARTRFDGMLGAQMRSAWGHTPNLARVGSMSSRA